MLEVYSINAEVAADAAIPFTNVHTQKGGSAELLGTSTIELNRCGVYEVSVNASADAATTIQLYKDGVAQPQAQSTGESLSFKTLVQVSENNTCCPCSSATSLQIMNTTAATFANVNAVVVKVPVERW